MPPGTRKFLLVRGVALSENNCSTALNGTTSFYFQRQKNTRQGVALFQNRSTALIAKARHFFQTHKKKYMTMNATKKRKKRRKKVPEGGASRLSTITPIKVLPQLVELIYYCCTTFSGKTSGLQKLGKVRWVLFRIYYRLCKCRTRYLSLVTRPGYMNGNRPAGSATRGSCFPLLCA